MLGSAPDLQTRIKNWKGSLPNIGELNYLFCDGFQLDKTMPDVENRIGVLPTSREHLL